MLYQAPPALFQDGGLLRQVRVAIQREQLLLDFHDLFGPAALLAPLLLQLLGRSVIVLQIVRRDHTQGAQHGGVRRVGVPRERLDHPVGNIPATERDVGRETEVVEPEVAHAHVAIARPERGHDGFARAKGAIAEADRVHARVRQDRFRHQARGIGEVDHDRPRRVLFHLAGDL